MEKVNKLKNKKKITAIFFVLLFLIGNLSNVFASSGTGTWKGYQYSTYYRTQESAEYGITARSLINTGTGEKHTVFCSELGVDFHNGVSYNGSYYTPTSSVMKKACKIAYFGWYSKYGNYVVDEHFRDDAGKAQYRKDYAFTQQYIWEAMGSDGGFLDSNQQAEYENFKVNLNNQINAYAQRPSFDTETIEVEAGETKVITDTNGVFKNYNSINETKDGITFSHNKGENTLKISVPTDFDKERVVISEELTKSWNLIKEGTEDNDTSIYFDLNDGGQDQLISMNYNDPTAVAMEIRVDLLGNIELTKLNDNGDLIDGAVFSVTGAGYNGDVTVTNGKIKLEKIKKGTYTIKEKSAPNGYLINNETYKVEVKPNETATQTIVNQEPLGEVTITKEDKELKNTKRVDGTVHHGDVNIAGAEYTLYADEDIYNKSKTIKYFSKDDEIAKFTFNDVGVASIKIISSNSNLKVNGSTLSNMPLGKYYAKETKVPVGYLQDTEKHTITLSYKDSLTKTISISENVTNQVQKAKFKVIKISGKDSNTAKVVEDAEFTAILTKYVKYYGSFDEALKHLDEYSKDEYSVFKTDENGHGISNLLAYGEYTVNETVVPSAEMNKVDEFYVTIDKDSNGAIKEFVENDTPFESYLKIIKIDENTGKKITFSNASFKLYKLNRETNEWEETSCKIGKERTFTWTTDKNAVAYTEDKLEAGTYKIDEIKVPTGFVKLEEDCIFEVNTQNKTLEYDNEFDAYITVTIGNKQPVANITVKKTIELVKDADLSLVNVKDLSGIKFKLTAKDTIRDMADGSVIYKKGAEIGTYNLNKEGTLTIKNLPLGVYELQEVETLKGLVLDNTKHEIKLTQKDTTTTVYNHTENIVNKTITVEFSKTDITGDKELEGATLQVKDDKNNVIDEWVSGNKTHKIEGLESGKTYKLIETIAPDGYAKSTEIEFKVENTNEIQKVTMIDKVVEISKTDLTNGEEVEGAKLQVVDEEGNIIDEWTSTKEAHKVKGLEEGKTYKLIEYTAPYGYEIAEDITFTVSYDKETQHIEMKDMPILKNIKLVKIDTETKEVIKDKFTFGIYEDEQCTKLIQKVESNTDDGTITFENLRYGLYFIKEISAPKDYLISDRVVKVALNDKGVFIDDVETEEKDEVYSFEFENQKIETPKTGDTRHTLVYAIIFVISAVALGVISIIRFKRRK